MLILTGNLIEHETTLFLIFRSVKTRCLHLCLYH